MAQLLFAILSIGSIGFFLFKASKIRRNINLGRDEKITGNVPQRIKNVLLVALGQQKMFKRWLPATLHAAIYVAFLITQIELIEIFIDGFTGNHRLIWHTVEGTFLGGIYTFVIGFIEVLSVLAFVATFAFLARRNLLKIPRFHKPEMNGWPKLDGNIILYLEICLIVFIFMMNSGDLALQANGHASYHHTDSFAISQFIAPLWSGMSESSIILIERIGWWGHILTVFAFLNYLPYSKHLHIMLAFPNVYFARVEPKGQMSHLDSVTEQVNELFADDETVTTEPVFETANLKTETNPSVMVEVEAEEESMADIFGDLGSEEISDEGIEDIFGDLGSSEYDEGIEDIFGDVGTSEEKEEDLSDIFGDLGSSESEEESLDDIFGDTGSSESVDDVFGDTQEESIDDIFGSEESESVDDIFASDNDSNETEALDDLFGESQSNKQTTTTAIAQEVAATEEEHLPKFGVSDVFDLSWKHILAAYSCTECGRCTSVCPANITGKKLSPRKIMMDVRDRAEEIGRTLDANPNMTKENYDDGKDLFSYITTEELQACTTCNACVEACPVMIAPLDIIQDMRRNLILDKAEAPEPWNVMFTNIENNGAPWQFSSSDREKWIEEL